MEREVICLDTSVLIDYFRKKDKRKSFLFRLDDAGYTLVTTSITTFEVYRGVTPVQQNFWDSFFEQIEIFSFDEESSKIAAFQLRSLQLLNRAIALPDLMIASIAIRNNLKVATLNIKDFERINTLKILSE